jgi:hypothetical protein
MANTHLRSALSRVLNSENEGPMRNKLVGKAGLAAPAAGGLKSRPVRGAMQEIGNNAAILTNRDTTNKGKTYY